MSAVQTRIQGKLGNVMTGERWWRRSDRNVTITGQREIETVDNLSASPLQTLLNKMKH